jgi:threonine dehydrogenase-like Zn-dependent dehydrogenase
MTSKTMKAAVFVERGRIELREKPIPEIGPDDALVRVTTTTICGSDIHIRKGEYAVAPGLTIGHEPVGIIEKLGSAVKGYKEGDRVLCSAVTPGGYSSACMCGMHAYDGGDNQHGWQIAGGWRLGNTIDGAQAEFFVVPHAQANLAIVPNQLTDEEVLMVPDMMSTGFSGAESGKVGIGDIVAIFAQGPVGPLRYRWRKALRRGESYCGGRIAKSPGNGKAHGCGSCSRFHQGGSSRGNHEDHLRSGSGCLG